MKSDLSVNVDHVATLRQARGGEEPDPIGAAKLALDAGAAGLTFHLREDRRHIQDHDLKGLKALGRGVLNMEMALTDEMIGIALALKPDRATLVPERRAELTTEGGLEIRRNTEALAAGSRRLVDAGIRVSLFLDPIEEVADLIPGFGATIVEIHTGHYANARGADVVDRELARIAAAARRFAGAGLTPHAGHGLTVANVGPLLHRYPFRELSIGHSIVSRAVHVGMAKAVREMLSAIEAA